MFGFGKKKDTPAKPGENDAREQPQEQPQDQPRDKPQDPPLDHSQDKPRGLFGRLRAGLAKTRSGLADGLAKLVLGAKTLDEDLLEEIETRLLGADVGVEATDTIIERLTQRVSRKELKDPQALLAALREEMAALLEPVDVALEIPTDIRPFVILMVGVNGVGKTTTIGKLARRFQDEGRSVMLAAGDTFRAAAVEQLKVWGERNGIPVIAQPTGADSASVAFDALESARAKGVDVLLIDTAGRLHTQSNLMDELKKVHRVLGKLDPDAPHEVMLTLDAGNGQNAISQAEQFHAAVKLSGINVTKLDGTAKGGVIFGLAKQLGIPVRFIGVGEGIEDLRPFGAGDFVAALFDDETGR